MAKNGIKILLVEDEDNLRKLIASELMEFGYEVHEAQDGVEGLAMAEKVRPDIVLSDVVMPKKSGNDLLKELRKTTFGKDIPFIVLTARVRMKDYFEDMKVTAFIEKPFKIAVLVKAVEDAWATVQKTKALQGQTEDLKSDPSRSRQPIKADEIIASAAEDFVDTDLVRGLDATANDFKKPVKTKKALLVEDDVKVTSKIEKVLFKNGYLVHTTATAARCIDEGANYGPDVIFLKDIISGVKADILVK
ncbi:MAG: response regulator, partial [Candidatus Omnitrophota bacterium]